MKLCRHCNDATVSRPRGLCWRCYYAPGVKDIYANGNRYGVGIDVEPEPATTPTAARPGTEEKIAVMEARVAAGQHLHHESDRTGMARYQPCYVGQGQFRMGRIADRRIFAQVGRVMRKVILEDDQ